MSDGTKIAAALLAAEASRQRAERFSKYPPVEHRDIARDILSDYDYFLGEVAKRKPQD